MVPSLESMDEILNVTIQMKATKQYFPVMLFIMLYKVALAFDSVDQDFILKLNYPKVLSGTFI